MKNNITKKICWTLVAFILFSSCSDELLDVKSTSTITNASFWKTEDDVKGGLNGIYVQLRNAMTNIYILGEARSELFTHGNIGSGGYDIYYLNTLHPDNAGPNWQSLYTTVNSVNLILKYTPKISFESEKTRNHILAQAYTMRAYLYFVMTRTWGSLIIRTDPVESSNPEVTYKERSAQEEVFAFIKEDLTKAIGLFPDNTFPSGRCFWSKPAAYALMADVYLWTGKRMGGGISDFNQALTALNEVKKADIALLPKFADVLNYSNKGNKELIMTVRYQDNEVTDNYFSLLWITSAAVPSYLNDYAKSIIFPIGGQGGMIVPSEVFRKQYFPDDTRKAATFYEIFVDNDPDKDYFTSLVVKCPGLVQSGTRKFLDDVVIYRYADILLMIAEAKNALGQDPSAEINQVRARAYGENYSGHLFVNGSKQNNDDAILKERLLELAFEGKRWWDLVRFNKAFDLVPSLTDDKGKDYMLLYPISNSILSKEPKVKQNPGW
jgi:hypothetical protein